MTDDWRRHSTQLWLLAAIERYGPCEHTTLFEDVRHENHWPHDPALEDLFRRALIELKTAGLVQLLPVVELTQAARDVLAAAAQPPPGRPVPRKRWWRR